MVKDISAVMEMLPHRFPMLLVDRIVEYISGESLTALKNVTFNENFFNGHFPGAPIMPGVLIVEALAQAAALYVGMEEENSAKDRLVYFMSIEQAKFRKPVTPGDSLYLRVRPVQQRRNVHKFACEAYVADAKTTEATLTAMIADK
ncbi:MAG: 3-hydroxyacyl-ACP dehydratase FabZ [Rickettsiales bacterium]